MASTPPSANAAGRGWHPLFWVGTAYVAEGIPFAMVIWVAGTMFKDMGHSDSSITIATASIGVVWSLKPLWAGFLDLFLTKKFFVIVTELVMAGLFLVSAASLHVDGYFTLIIAALWLVAIASATQDICVDGVYITTLDEKKQAAYIGLQGMAWNLGRIIAVSAAVWMAGYLRRDVALDLRTSWSIVLCSISGLMLLLAGYHIFVLPTGSRPAAGAARTAKRVFAAFRDSAADFCDRPFLWGMLSFVLFFRSAEGLLLVEAPLFLQGCLEDGGLQLSLKDKGFIDGTVGTVAVIVGGLLGGLVVSRYTLKRTLFLLALCVNLPNLAFLYLAHAAVAGPPSVATIAALVGFEKFWYGFGFIGNMLYMMQQVAPGKYKMTHYAFATALMNLVLVPTQMVSGPLADWLGFRPFFWVVLLATVPSLITAWLAPFPNAAEGGPIATEPDVVDDGPRRWAQRATIRALLALGAFLYIDTLVLGWLGTAEVSYTKVSLLIALIVSVTVKVALSFDAIRWGRRALASGLGGRDPRVSNGRGAIVGGVAMVAVSVVLVGVVAQQATGSDWSCLGRAGAGQCSVAPAKTKLACDNPVPRG